MTGTIPEAMRRVYDLVAEETGQAPDAAFLDVLPRVEESLRSAVLERLFKRNNVSALCTLVGRFKSYDEPLAALIVSHVDELFEATRMAIGSESEETRFSAIELIRRSRNCRLAYLLSDALTRPCPQTKATATATLAILTDDLLERRERERGAAARRHLHVDAKQLGEALGRALDVWSSHYRTDVLMAAMMLPDVMESAIFQKASHTRLNVARGISAALRGETPPGIARFALRALCHPELRVAAAEKLASAAEAGFVGTLLDEMWTTTDPENARACGWIKSLPWLSDIALSDGIDTRLAFHAARLVGLSGLSVEEKLRTYREWIGCASAPLREAAIWRVCESDSAWAAGTLREATTSRDPTVAQIATLELSRRDPSRSSGAGGRQRRVDLDGAENRADSEITDFWVRFEELTAEHRVKTGRRLRTKHAERFDRFLRERLTTADAGDRLRALNVTRTLELTSDFDASVYALSHDADERIRSLAVAMLNDLEGATAMRILRMALNDPDERVQANAVDTLASLDVQSLKPELINKLKSENNRVRANAIKALLAHRVRDAAVMLIHMLQDPSPRHRISALWVVEQLGLSAMASRVDQIASSDPDARVRERAEKTLCEPAFLAAMSKDSSAVQMFQI